MKRALSTFLVILIMVVFCPTEALAAGQTPGLSNFKPVNTYVNGQFKDVSASAWFAENVVTAFELGLMQGSNGYFNASGDISIAETIVLASRLHSIYYADGVSFEQGTPWYQVYVDYALQNGILTHGYSDYTKAATRAEFAVILAASLPDEALSVINSIEDGAIPDVSMPNSFAGAVYKLYRAGILTGNDSVGTFTPYSKIGRNAVAAIVTRMADPALRKSLSLSAKHEKSAKEIYANCSPAVFCIVAYDMDGDPYSQGSGFFIDSSGIAVTNYHVIQNAFSADITTTNGVTYSGITVLGYDMDQDIAILKIKGSGFSYLPVGDSSQIQGGETVYAIGNPEGLTNTITEGLISNPCRKDVNNMIQISVPISHGSSGGALINAYGEVIGITSAGLATGQNLNFAVPINAAMALSRNNSLTLPQVAKLDAIAGYYNAPDAYDYNVEEEEPNNTWQQSMYIDNGTSVWGMIDDEYLDEFYVVCNTTGQIEIVLMSDSPNQYIKDLILAVSLMGSENYRKADTVYLDDGTAALYLTYDIPQAGFYTIDILSNSLYKTGNLHTDYAFYYLFTPDGC